MCERLRCSAAAVIEWCSAPHPNPSRQFRFLHASQNPRAGRPPAAKHGPAPASVSHRQSRLMLNPFGRALRKVNREPVQLTIKHAFQQFVPDVKEDFRRVLRRSLRPPGHNPARKDCRNHIQHMFFFHTTLPAMILGASLFFLVLVRTGIAAVSLGFSVNPHAAHIPPDQSLQMEFVG